MTTDRHYHVFRYALDKMPLPALVEFAEKQREMIEEEFASRETALSEEDFPIINFCHFVEAMAKGAAMPSCVVPYEHERFYRQIIQRLVDAKELPAYAVRQFDAAFSPVFSE